MQHTQRTSNQPTRSTQPVHLSVGKRNEYRSKGGDALRLGSKGSKADMAGVWWQVKLCEPLVPPPQLVNTCHI